MENKLTIPILVAALLSALFFLGASITGMVVQSVEYEDICHNDADCTGTECCIIYEDDDLGLCMSSCQSKEFLCTDDSQCEVGTVCCISEGMRYGICNKEENCISIDLLSEFAAKKARLEKPAPITYDKDMIILFETSVIIVLIGMIIWLVRKKK